MKKFKQYLSEENLLSEAYPKAISSKIKPDQLGTLSTILNNDLKIDINTLHDKDLESISSGRDKKLKDKSYVDIGISKRIAGRFSFHWECKNEMVFRYDNFPDEQWECVDTFPFHFHNGSQSKVDPSPFSTDLMNGFREFMGFIRNRL